MKLGMMAAGQQGAMQKQPYMDEGPHTQVNPNNTYEQNYQIVQKYGGDANYMMFEQMYGDERTAAQEPRLYGPADGLSPFNSYEQNRERMRGDSDAALMDYYYNPQRSTNPSAYTEGLGPGPEAGPGPAEHGYNRIKELLMKKKMGGQ